MATRAMMTSVLWRVRDLILIYGKGSALFRWDCLVQGECRVFEMEGFDRHDVGVGDLP